MRTKRALILTGAGASLAFGAPSTARLTRCVERKLLADDWMRRAGGDRAWCLIKDTLDPYLKDFRDGVPSADVVNFEHIYHCAHELLSTFEPTPGAAREFRPILVPFVDRRFRIDSTALNALVSRIGEFIFAEMSAVCERPSRLAPLSAFLAKVRADYVTRAYTTNYDDFLLQAAPDLYTGFAADPRAGAKIFDPQAFWSSPDRDCVFHLHGSVHLCFGLSHARDADLGSLYWYDDRTEALRHASHRVADDQRMDGGGTVRIPIITGLDKLSPLQRQPFSHYYATMAHDAISADIVFVIGCGLGDLHLNTWLGDARRRDPKPPLVFIDLWDPCFVPPALPPDLSRKEVEMIHSLRMSLDHRGLADLENGWHIDVRDAYAIWDRGFDEFLRAPSDFAHVLEQLV